MADATKSQKLAAAKKKLKEYQQKSKKPETGEENLHTNDALSNSTHSSINGGFDIVPLETVSTNIGDTNQRSPFQNYFNPERQNVVTEQKDFFDSLSFQTNTNHPPISNVQDSHINAIFNEKHSDPGSLEYPELTESKPYGVYTEKPVDHPFVSFEDARKLSDYMTDATNGVEEIVPAEKSLVNSNIESLRQLSSEINELIKVEPDTHDDSDLERRNVELARLLDQECLVSHTARNQLRESQSQVEQLQCECQQIKTDYEHRLNREVGPLQEQLQCHAQTVGILIAEKTELYTEKPVDHPFVSFEDARKLSDYMTDATNGVEEIVPAEKSLVNSNIESLRQLSSEINELIKVEPDTHDDSDLERRNVELARLLDQECLVSHTARNQLRESQSQVEQLQCECQQIKTDYEHRLNREVGPLQEQLQCHAQTVGILIAEKTEL
ncbi:golgin subfamily A member 2-like, partial [Photinus pyralis]|uniref:golgin subfamily A member 2-like n=1 Tax=Photinus pyralis TaxID=7054 RepID=UPI001267128A